MVQVRDHAAMRWAGANSYRTGHYPYSEADLDLADALGLLVVAEAPTVGLSFTEEEATVQARQAQSLRALSELLRRDCCRACVVAWSVCNEPGGPQQVPTGGAKELQSECVLQVRDRGLHSISASFT